MPREIRSSDQFQKLLPKAQELRVVRFPEFVKLKIRTPEYLFTYKANPDEAEDIIKSAKDIEVVEFTPIDEKQKKAAHDAAKEQPKDKEKEQPAKKKKTKQD